MVEEGHTGCATAIACSSLEVLRWHASIGSDIINSRGEGTSHQASTATKDGHVIILNRRDLEVESAGSRQWNCQVVAERRDPTTKARVVSFQSALHSSVRRYYALVTGVFFSHCWEARASTSIANSELCRRISGSAYQSDLNASL